MYIYVRKHSQIHASLHIYARCRHRSCMHLCASRSGGNRDVCMHVCMYCCTHIRMCVSCADKYPYLATSRFSDGVYCTRKNARKSNIASSGGMPNSLEVIYDISTTQNLTSRYRQQDDAS